AGLDVGDAEVQEARHSAGILRSFQHDLGLVGCGTTPGVHDDPAVRELDDARVLLQHDLPAEDVAVETPRAGDITHSEKVGHDEPLGGGGHVGVHAYGACRSRAPQISS